MPEAIDPPSPPSYAIDRVGRAYVVRDCATARIVGRHVRLTDAVRMATAHAAERRRQGAPDSPPD